MKRLFSVFTCLMLLTAVGCDKDDTGKDGPAPDKTVKPVLTKTYQLEIAADGETVASAATLSLVDGEGAPLDLAANKAKVTVSCSDNAQATLNDAGVISIVFPANASDKNVKTYTLTATGSASQTATLTFTQAVKGTKPVVIEPILAKSYDKEIAAAGETIAAAANLSLVDGEGAPLDLATNKANITVTCSDNAQATFTDAGVISIVFPANASETNTKTYTLTVTGSATKSASLTFTQAKKPVGPNVLRFAYGNPAETHPFDAAGGEFMNGAIASLTLGGADVMSQMTAENVRVAAEYESGVDPWLNAALENTVNFQWKIVAPFNVTSVERRAKVYMYFNNTKSENFVEFTQQAGTGEVYIKPALTKNHETQIVAAGETVATAATLSLTDHTGAPLGIAANKAKLTISCTNNGQATLADDGTIRIVFPENTTDAALSYTLRVDGTYSTSASVIFSQAAKSGGGEPVGHTFSYTLFTNAADGSKGTGFGGGAGAVGDWYRFENITIDGTVYTPGQMLQELVANPELIGALMKQAFSFGTLAADDVQVPGVDPLTEHPESFVTLQPWNDGGAAVYVRIVLGTNDTGARRTFKIVTKNGDGSALTTVVYFQNA